jgi:hypothetical protein
MNYVELWQNCAKLVDENIILKKMIECYEKISNNDKQIIEKLTKIIEINQKIEMITYEQKAI